jgi:hypothetical protein
LVAGLGLREALVLLRLGEGLRRGDGLPPPALGEGLRRGEGERLPPGEGLRRGDGERLPTGEGESFLFSAGLRGEGDRPRRGEGLRPPLGEGLRAARLGEGE